MTTKNFLKTFEAQLNRAKVVAITILGLGFMSPDDYFDIDFAFTMFKAFTQAIKEGKADPAKYPVFGQRLAELDKHLNKLQLEANKSEGVGPYYEFTKAVGSNAFN